MIATATIPLIAPHQDAATLRIGYQERAALRAGGGAHSEPVLWPAWHACAIPHQVQRVHVSFVVSKAPIVPCDEHTTGAVGKRTRAVLLPGYCADRESVGGPALSDRPIPKHML